MRVVGISGSLRKASYNSAALRAAGSLMPDDMTLEIADIGDLPMYNHDDERDHGLSAPAQRLRDQVSAANALLVATPEYNYSITGALKNAIDWLSRPPDPPINLMPTAILGVGGRLGTARAQRHFRDIAQHNDLRMVQQPEVLISSPWEKFDDQLNLTDDRALDQIQRLVMALRALTLRIQATRKRVLVVGRDQYELNVLSTRLRELGHEPVGVADDDSAMSLIDPGQFPVVLIHWQVEAGSRHKLATYAGAIAPATVVIDLDETAHLSELLERALDQPDRHPATIDAEGDTSRGGPGL